MRRPFRIGTRQSPLALAQTELVRRELLQAHPEFERDFAIEIVSMKTTGDHILDRNLSEIGGKGLFTKELEEALLVGQVDIVVHSMKDMSAVYPSGLIVPTILKREDPRDALIGPFTSIKDIPQMAVIGTSSTRRAAQLKHIRPDLQIIPFRGNVQTRIEKLSLGVADATLLAVAGLHRLGLDRHIAAIFETDLLLPAVAQGAIGIQCREDDQQTRAFLRPLNHQDAADCVQAERAFLAVLDGSCKTPLAALAKVKGDEIQIDGLIAHPMGDVVIRQSVVGPRSEAAALGQALAQQLLAQGGREILNVLRGV